MFKMPHRQHYPVANHTRLPHRHENEYEEYMANQNPQQRGGYGGGGGGGDGSVWAKDDQRRFTGGTTDDLVDQTVYLYVQVVKAKDLPPGTLTGSCDPYVEVKLGNYRGRTRHLDRTRNPEWKQVFAFSKDQIQASFVELLVKDKDMVGRDDYLGGVVFDLNEVPTRLPPDSPLAPQWYRLEDRRGAGKVRGEIMVAVWMGTQADEAFPDAWHSDAASVRGGDGVPSIRSKVYVTPKLWYLRVNVIEAQDVVPNDMTNRMGPDLFVKVQVGNQVLRTKMSTHLANPIWNEDLVFVVAEPFEEQMILTVEDRVNSSKDDVLGKISLPINAIERRLDHRTFLQSRWFNLEKFGFGILEADRRKEYTFSSRVHIRACLEGGYHVLDESTMFISDQRPTARQLWKPPVGVLEVGILNAKGLLPMKMMTNNSNNNAKDGSGRGGGGGSITTDAYCVAKYGQKWVRTRTILDNLNPNWNEQYTWEVYDPSTVFTLGVFDNCNLKGVGVGDEKQHHQQSNKVSNNGDGNGVNGGNTVITRDSRIGKVRIRISTLESNRLYENYYPLAVLHPDGVKKMGELCLAVRFTSLSLINMIYLYGKPLLPKMHYIHPFTVSQIDSLRYQAMNIVASRLARAEPPLRKEVVEYMLDVDSNLWSMRRSKANFFRVMSLLSGTIGITQWFSDVCNWRNPTTSTLVHVLFLILVMYPELLPPTIFLHMFLIGLWNYRYRPRSPPHMDLKLSWAEAAHPDELEEELDTFPTSATHDMVRMRYDRLRSLAGRIQIVVGDIATQGERFQSLLCWRDPRSTSLFMIFSLFAAVVLYVTPFRAVILVAGLYLLRHPRFRGKLPSVPVPKHAALSLANRNKLKFISDFAKQRSPLSSSF